MGLREWAAQAQYNGSFEGYTLHGKKVKKGMRAWPVAGAVAQCESGAAASRMTLTRIGVGAVVLGPLGAIFGGMARKNKGRVYVLIEFSTGDAISFDVPVKQERDAREFVNKVNGASRLFASQSA